MIKPLLCASAIAVILSAAVAHDAMARKSRLYLAGYMGLNVTSDLEYSETQTGSEGKLELDNAMQFAGALGLRVTKNFRLEAEASYRKANLNSLEVGGAVAPVGGKLRTTLFMLNGIYDFRDLWEDVNPYVNAGIGLALHDADIEGTPAPTIDTRDSDLALAWALGGGLRYKVREGMAFTGGYRYIGSTEIGLDSASVDYGAHELRIGVSYDLYQ